VKELLSGPVIQGKRCITYSSPAFQREGGWSLMIFFARATRGLRRPSLDARSGRSISPHPWRDNERAWNDHLYRSTRAIEDQPGHPEGASGRKTRAHI